MQQVQPFPQKNLQGNSPSLQATTFPHAKRIRPIPQTYFRANKMSPTSIFRDFPKSPRSGKKFPHTADLYSYLSLKFFIRALKAQRLLSKYWHYFYTRQSLQDNDILQILKTFSSVTSMKFSSLISDQNDVRLFKILLINLASLKNLAHLEISIHFYQMKSQKTLHILTKYLQRVNTLTSFSLKLSYKSQRSCLQFGDLFSQLGKFIQLRKLKLSFLAIERCEDPLNQLVSMLPKLCLLTKFSLALPKNTINLNSSLVLLFQTLQNLKALSSVTLKLHASEIINPNDVEPFSVGLAAFNHTSVQELSFKFYQTFTEANLLKFSSILKQFTSLRALRLSFLDCFDLTSINVNELCQTLSHFTSLNHLELTLSQCSQAKNDSAFRNITYVLRPFMNLIRLKLSFGSLVTTTDQDIQQLFSNLKCLKRLKSLALDFSSQDLITDKALGVLGQSLGELVLLKNLSLNFANTGFVTDQGIELLASTVRNLQNLSELQLNLSNLNQIHERAITKIGEALQDLPSLSSAMLNLWGCSKVSSFEDFLTTFKNIKNRMKITLDLQTSPSLYQRRKELCQMKKNLEIRFPGEWEQRKSSEYDFIKL